MNHASLVRRLERVRDVSCDVERLFDRNRSTLNALRQRLAFHQLENEEPRLTGLLDVVDRPDIGMIQRGENLSLALEPANPLRVARKLIRQNLDRNVALQLQVAPSIHLAHSAFAEQTCDLVIPKLGSDGKGHKLAQ